jgi:hypothetical protein
MNFFVVASVLQGGSGEKGLTRGRVRVNKIKLSMLSLAVL